MSDSLFKIQQIQATISDVLLKEWDPIGISGVPEAQDEYGGYVAEIYELVAHKASQAEIFAHLWRIETDYMGLAGNRPKTESVAKRLFEMEQA